MAAQEDSKLNASHTGQKVVITVKDCATHIYVDDTEIEYPLEIGMNVDATGIPVIRIKMLAPDLRLITDGSASIEFEDGGKKDDHKASVDRQRIHRYRGDFHC